MDYELYHDESQENGYWHGILLVPASKKSDLISYLQKARDNKNYFNPVSLKDIRKSRGSKYEVAFSWAQIAFNSLIQDFKNDKAYAYFGITENGHKMPEPFEKLIQAKFILFLEKDSHQEMGLYPDLTSRIETTFRISFKGGLHFLFDHDSPVNIVKFHFDGWEHHKRHINKDRIIGRLYGLREYCSIADTEDLIDDRTSNHNKSTSQSYEDCQLLQLTDILVSGFRTALGVGGNDAQKYIARPFKRLFDEYLKGIARMRNSRWNNGYCLSQCYLQNDEWNFETIDYLQQTTVKQLSLF